MQWCVLFEDPRSIQVDYIGEVRVSTVYLGLNHELHPDRLR